MGAAPGLNHPWNTGITLYPPTPPSSTVQYPQQPVFQQGAALDNPWASSVAEPPPSYDEAVNVRKPTPAADGGTVASISTVELSTA